jgi:hypothetical protein
MSEDSRPYSYVHRRKSLIPHVIQGSFVLNCLQIILFLSLINWWNAWANQDIYLIVWLSAADDGDDSCEIVNSLDQRFPNWWVAKSLLKCNFFNDIKIKNHKKWESEKNKTKLENGKKIKHIIYAVYYIFFLFRTTFFCPVKLCGSR